MRLCRNSRPRMCFFNFFLLLETYSKKMAYYAHNDYSKKFDTGFPLVGRSASFPEFTQSLPGCYLVQKRWKGRKSRTTDVLTVRFIPGEMVKQP